MGALAGFLGSAGGAAAIGGIGDIIGGVLGSSGASSANKVMRRYNTYMSNTAVQRRKEDLLKAGFNPLLAVGDPASSSGVMQGNVAEPLGRGVSSAANKVAQAVQLENVKADTAQKMANTASIRATTPQGGDPSYGEMMWQQKQAEVRLTQFQADQAETISSKLVQDLDSATSQAFIARNEAALSTLTLDQARFVLPMLRAAVERESVKASNDLEVQQKAGWLLSWIRAISNAISAGANSAESLQRLMPGDTPRFR